MYLSGSAFLVSLTDPNKQLLYVKSVSTFLKRGSNVKKHIDLLLI